MKFHGHYAGSMSHEIIASPEDSITPLAVTNYRDIRRIFGIKQKNRRGHMYLLGKTGTGKSTLLSNMAISDIQEGKGVALIDPHGDLAEELLHFIPKNRIGDVIYFNPGDLGFPIAFNPLSKVPHEFRHLVAAGIISTFKKIWPEFWGPRLEHILRHALLTLLDQPESTLLDLPRLLTQKSFRDEAIKHVQSQHVREFWFHEFERYSAWMRSEAVSPILNKVSLYLTSPLLRNIVGQAKSTFEMREIMDQGKILIANLAKGTVGEDAAALLGSMLVTSAQLAALSRTDLPEPQRRGFYLYVDEVHNFLTLSFAHILSEARKYGLNLVLAHQYIEQLEDKIKAAIFGNAGTIIAFRVGAEDAKYLAREFYPVFSEADLVNLPNYHIYLKLMIDGHSSQPFSAVTLPPIQPRGSSKEPVIERSRQQFATDRKTVEQKIKFQSFAQSEKPANQNTLFS